MSNTSQYVESDTQLHLDLREPKWRQLELPLDVSRDSSEPLHFYNDNALFVETGLTFSDPATATIVRTTSEDVQSRLTISPELKVEVSRKIPNRLIQFFHKHLLGITWESV